MDNYCIIMAGGIGSRFWPLSKNNYPKQFLDILGTGKSFIRSTYERFCPIVPTQNFLVVTNAAYKELVLEHIPELQPEQILCEPLRRNTAPCIAYATYRIAALLGHQKASVGESLANANIVVTPADHLVTNETEFHRIIKMGFDYVQQPAHTRALLTIGIQPSRPETGYGYIEIPTLTHQSDTPIVKVTNFKEKPDFERAKAFIEAGNYLWNSGIFIWSLKGIIEAFHTHLPDMAKIFENGVATMGTPQEQNYIDEHFPLCENISIDYGIMERSQNRFTIPADFGWSDIGTWGSLHTHAQHDELGNSTKGKIVVEESQHCVINIEEGTEAIVQGLDHYLVAFKDHSLVVCRLDDEQHIKDWVEKL